MMTKEKELLLETLHKISEGDHPSSGVACYIAQQAKEEIENLTAKLTGQTALAAARAQEIGILNTRLSIAQMQLKNRDKQIDYIFAPDVTCQ